MTLPPHVAQASQPAGRGLSHPRSNVFALIYSWGYPPLFPNHHGLSGLFAGGYLYKRSNRLWRFLIKHQLVHAAWRPLVELTRLRHLAFRQRLAKQPQPAACGMPMPASV
jgi:hypothetical protein